MSTNQCSVCFYICDLNLEVIEKFQTNNYHLASTLEFRVYYYFALFTNNYYYIKVHYRENKNISKINYRSEKKMCAVTKVA